MMFKRLGCAQAHDQYRDVYLAARIETASPHELVAIMYERLIESLDVMAVAISHGRTIRNSKHCAQALAIIVALQASLDMKKGGALAISLSEIYQGMNVRLARAINAEDGEQLRKLRTGLAAIADAWSKVGTSINPAI